MSDHDNPDVSTADDTQRVTHDEVLRRAEQLGASLRHTRDAIRRTSSNPGMPAVAMPKVST